jgi:hypothetical protein
MVKLLLLMVCLAATAVVMLELRQQRLELSYQCASLHKKIEKAQLVLWNQQLQIANETTPTAIRKTVKDCDITLVPGKSYVPDMSKEEPNE